MGDYLHWTSSWVCLWDPILVDVILMDVERSRPLWAALFPRWGWVDPELYEGRIMELSTSKGTCMHLFLLLWTVDVMGLSI